MMRLDAHVIVWRTVRERRLALLARLIKAGVCEIGRADG